MAYILDIAVILIFVLAIFIGYRRGFVKSIIRLVGCLLALVIAGTLSGASKTFTVKKGFLAGKVKEQIVTHIPAADTASIKTGLHDAIEQMPGFVKNALDAYDLGSPDAIVDSLGDTLSGNVDAVAQTISDKVIRPVAVLLLQMVCFFVLFIILIIVVGILAAVINKAFKLPGLKQMNGALGAIFGAVEGLLWVLVAVTVIQLVATSSAGDSLLSAKNLHDSLLVSKIADVNPIISAMDSVIESLTAG